MVAWRWGRVEALVGAVRTREVWSGCGLLEDGKYGELLVVQEIGFVVVLVEMYARSSWGKSFGVWRMQGSSGIASRSAFWDIDWEVTTKVILSHSA